VSHTKVLVVEDDASLRVVIRMVLEQNGCQVREAAHGAAALEDMVADTPDLVLADVKMPGITGHELVRNVRSTLNLRSIPVVLLTGNTDIKHSETLADAVLVKPFEPGQLMATIRRLARDRDHTP
jgi:chemosensory pili system protein ChpA (sensor histidine kinase/response regulator)